MKYFAIITDQHIIEPGATLYGLDTNGASQRLVRRLIQEHIPLEGIICLGDLADTVQNKDRSAAIATSEAYLNARKLFEPLNLPMYVIPGNHDAPLLLEQFFPNRWDTNEHGVRTKRILDMDLVGLDLRTGPEPTGHVSQRTIQRLNEVLGEASNAIIFSHYPIFDLDNDRINRELSTTNRSDLADTLCHHKAKITAGFHGHLHLWITCHASGFTTYGVPSSSFIFTLEPQSSVKEKVGDSPCGYFLLGIDHHGSIIVRTRHLPAPSGL